MVGAIDIWSVSSVCSLSVVYERRCIYLFMCLFILHIVTSGSSDFTVIFKVYQDRLCQKASLLISVPPSSSRLRNPSIAERGEKLCLVYCDSLCCSGVHLGMCVGVIPAYSDVTPILMSGQAPGTHIW